MEKKNSLHFLDHTITMCKMEDMQKKIDIAFNVLSQCQQDSGIPIKDKKTSFEICSNLTGVDHQTLTAINKLEEKAISFNAWFNEQTQLVSTYNNAYCELKKQLIESYTRKLQIPTGLKNNKEFEGYKKYFTSIQLPGTKASIIVEKPETVQERCSFLYKKMTFQEAKKHLVYIGKVNILLNRGVFSYKEDFTDARSSLVIAASPILGHIGYVYDFGNNVELTNWLEEKIISKLPDESVVIFQENVLNSPAKKIDGFTSKEDMIKWLERNKVDYDRKMHRADLLKLINASKYCREELSTAEQTLRAHGHITIRKKKCNLNNNYFDPLWDFIISELNSTPELLQSVQHGLQKHPHIINRKVNVILQTITFDHWKDLENILIEKEREIYREDQKMEEVIDKLMTMVKHEGLKGVKLDEYSKVMEQPPLFLTDSLHNLLLQSTLLKYKGLNISKR